MDDHQKPSTQFRYYMIRVQTSRDSSVAGTSSPLAGMIERLGSGEKRDFSDAQELVRLVSTGWSDVPPNMNPGSETGNSEITV